MNVFDNMVGKRHVVAESSQLLATYGGAQIYNIKCKKDLDNGSIITYGEYLGNQIFESADYAEGKMPLFVLTPPMGYNSDRKEYQDEAYFYNAKDEIARAYEIKKGDFITVSEEAFGDSYVPVKGDMVDSAYAKASVAPATGYYGIVEDVIVTKLGRKSYRIYVAQV